MNTKSPIVAFDYCFMGEQNLDVHIDDDAYPAGNAKILVGRDSTSRCYNVVAVPQKGIDRDEYAVKRGLRCLDFLGYGLPPGSPSLGELMNQGKDNLDAPWLALSAFFSLTLVLSLLIFVGEALRDAFDPRR